MVLTLKKDKPVVWLIFLFYLNLRLISIIILERKERETMDNLLTPISEQNSAPKVLSFFVWGIICIIINLLILSYIGTNQTKVDVKIEMGSSTAQIAKILEDKGVIQNPILFKLLAKEKNLDDKLKAGYYTFPPRLTIGQVLDKLAKGETVFYTVTIPEGYNLEQIAALLSNRGLVDKQVFLKQARASNFNYPFLEEAKKSGESLEGYLFPATYHLEEVSTEKEILQAMLNSFGQVLDSSFIKRIENKGFSIHQIVTLASIVEKEAKVDQERSIISAVFHNRVNQGIRLQSCATVQYILQQPKKHLTYEDLKIDSPYNTYLHKGLPPGPIASPGRASLEAALNPAKVDYLFFVARGDGTHNFSKDFEQHRQAAGQIREKKKN